MGSDVYGLPSQETYLDSQNIHSDTAKISIFLLSSIFLSSFFIQRVFLSKDFYIFADALWRELNSNGSEGCSADFCWKRRKSCLMTEILC